MPFDKSDNYYKGMIVRFLRPHKHHRQPIKAGDLYEIRFILRDMEKIVFEDDCPIISYFSEEKIDWEFASHPKIQHRARRKG